MKDVKMQCDMCPPFVCGSMSTVALDYERGQLYPSERFGHGRCDVCLQCKARVMLAVIMNMYPSDKHGRVRCARWMLTASVTISCSIYSPAAFDTDC